MLPVLSGEAPGAQPSGPGGRLEMVTPLTFGHPTTTPSLRLRANQCPPSPGGSHRRCPGVTCCQCPLFAAGRCLSATVSARTPPLSTHTCAPRSAPDRQRPQPGRSVATKLGVSHEERPRSPPPTESRFLLPHPPRSPPAAVPPPGGAPCALPGAPQGSCCTAPGCKAGACPHHISVIIWDSAAASVR